MSAITRPRRAPVVTLRAGVLETSARAILKAWEPRGIVKFYGELGYIIHQRGMISGWIKFLLNIQKAREDYKDAKAESRVDDMASGTAALPPVVRRQ
jgi:hypothetical protein